MNVQTLYKRPLAGTATGIVWEIADRLLARDKKVPETSEIVREYLGGAAGRNESTARTQFSHWLQNHKARYKQGVKADLEGENDISVSLTIAGNGRLVIPVELRRAMQLAEDGAVMARLVDGELHLVTPKVALRKAQALVQSFDRGSGSIVDELIRERRAEASRE